VLLSVSSAARYSVPRCAFVFSPGRIVNRNSGRRSCVQQVQLAEVQRIVARHGGEVGVELVVGLREEIAVRVGEDASELAHKLIKFRFERPYSTIVSEKSPSDWPSPRARRQSPRFSMSACFDSSTSTSRGFVFAGVVAHLRDKAGLRHIEVAAALVHFFAGLVRRQRRPLGDDIEVGRDLQQRIEHQGPRLRDGLFHRQHTDEVIADAQMIALGLDVRVDHLIVEKLRGLRLARNPPVVVVEQAAKERELPLLIQTSICMKSPSCRVNAWTRWSSRRKDRLDLRPQQRLHAVVGELRLEFANRAGRIAEEAGERGSDAGLRPRAFEHDAVEDLNLIEMVALGLEELPPLVDGCFYNRVVIVANGISGRFDLKRY
jgi:hypothetical protein